MEFKDYAKKFLADRLDESAHATQHQITELKRQINRRLMLLLPENYLIIENSLIRKEDIPQIEKVGSDDWGAKQRKKQKEYEETLEKLYFAFSSNTDRKIKKEIKKDIVCTKKMLERAVLNQYCKKLKISVEKKLYLGDCNADECYLYDLLLNNIHFKKKNSPNNGNVIKDGNWEVLEEHIRTEIIKCIKTLRSDKPEKWPFSNKEFKEIQNKLTRPHSEYRKLKIKRIVEGIANYDILFHLTDDELKQLDEMISKKVKELLIKNSLNLEKKLEVVQKKYLIDIQEEKKI